MSEVDPNYVAARRVLLDALQALEAHREAVILVGAQAVYLQAGEADLEVTVSPYTADADLGIDPRKLGNDPRIHEAMTGAGFVLKEKGTGGIEPGTWLFTTRAAGKTTLVPVDLLVPQSVAPDRGKRDARLPEHGKNATRWTPGLEAALLDNTEMTITSLEPDVDTRTAVIRVAGPAALLVAKAHKIAERIIDEHRGKPQRVKPKDAADVIRLMRSPTTPSEVGARLAALARDEVCGPSVTSGVEHLRQLFGTRQARGVQLAVSALAGALPEEYVRALAPSYLDNVFATYTSSC